ncbi:MAG: ketoacyl-ACP synthase III [Armatimonadetes bacterium]|nr:ketoacyl-ACP synthase III [Armatimonadota bacterium]
MNNQVRRAGIVGIGSAIPEQVCTNQYFEKIVDTTDEWIFTRTGIKERRIAPAGEAASDLGARAAISALDSAGTSPEEIDLIICATISGDMPFPATASVIQDRLGASKAAAFDLAAGCSGFVYALASAASFIGSGVYDKVLIIGVDLLSRMTNYADRSTCVLFGDGAGAAVVAPADDSHGILSIVLGSDGSGADLLKVEAGGSRLPTTADTVQAQKHYIQMAGSEVFKFAVRVIGDAASEALEKCGLSPDEVDLFIPHQANIRIIDSAARRLKIPTEKVFVNVQKYGNTSAASIPIAIDEAVQEGRLKKGDTFVAVGFGAGLTWAASVIKWGMDSRDGSTH